MKRLNSVPICGNYYSNHPMITEPTQSTTCKGCINRDPIEPVDAYILNNDPNKINCKVFKEVEE